MRFLIISPQHMTVVSHECDKLDGALREAGLAPGKVDHGIAAANGRDGSGIGIVVDERSLFVPAREQSYFAIGARLYGGSAVLYGFDWRGESVDCDQNVAGHVRFYPEGARQIELEIAAGLVNRPEVATTMHGARTVVWQWPQPMPEGWLP